MMKEQEKEVLNGVVEDSKYMLRLSREYSFEGETYTYVDLSKLEDISANDMIKAQKIMEKAGNVSVLPEMSLEYSCIIAGLTTGMPVEFFKQLPAKDAIKLKNMVTSFLYGED